MKVLRVFVVFMMCFIASGCTKKEELLECSSIANKDGVAITQEYNINFNNDKLVKGSLLQSTEISDSLSRVIRLEDYKNNALDYWNKTSFKDLDYEITDNGYNNFTIKVNFDKKDFKKINGNIKNINDTKKELENAGFTCKKTTK